MYIENGKYTNLSLVKGDSYCEEGEEPFTELYFEYVNERDDNPKTIGREAAGKLWPVLKLFHETGQGPE